MWLLWDTGKAYPNSTPPSTPSPASHPEDRWFGKPREKALARTWVPSHCGAPPASLVSRGSGQMEAKAEEEEEAD